MSALVYIEQKAGEVKSAGLAALSAALQASDTVHALIVGPAAMVAAEKVAPLKGVSKVLVSEQTVFEHDLAEPIAALCTQLASQYTSFWAAATTTGKNFTPRVAALLDVMQVSDITAVKSSDTFVRPIYAGNAFETVKVLSPLKVITVRATSFDPVTDTDSSAPVEAVEFEFKGRTAEFVKEDTPTLERPELTEASIVVSGGRGLGSKEQFTLIEQLADKLGAAVGASRAAVDAGYVPNDYQVGQTGKVVAPELYIAIGISGAIQHIAGMKDAKIVVAINQDPEAPIFEVADYGLVGDLFKIVPELLEKL
ncbi:MAG: electron transfer flavoprotein subunit alpha [Legionellales bacterium]|nr:electron transfer flavoprotein subunit alpha [Legionellales bacterium]